ncbi:hypothetical protein Hanom_Chr12g01091991 [Helianthus anomalus]
MEEGEIRCNSPESGSHGGRNSDQSVHLEDEGVAFEQFPNDQHAWGDKVHGKSVQSPRASKSNYESGKVAAAGVCSFGGTCGDNYAGESNGPNGPLDTPGPSTLPPLGKRTRDQRSPPSVGSLQGPHVKIRQAEEDAGDRSLDLNGSTEHHDKVYTGSKPLHQNNLVDQSEEERNSTGFHAPSTSTPVAPVIAEIDATVAVGYYW